MILVLSDIYGLEDFIVGVFEVDEDEKYFIKLDWNINNNYCVDFIYSY